MAKGCLLASQQAAVVVVVAAVEAARAEALHRSSRRLISPWVFGNRPWAYRITNRGVSSCEGTFASSRDGLLLISSRVRPSVTLCFAHSTPVTAEGETATHLPPSQLLVSITR